jgi:hypothetical protein
MAGQVPVVASQLHRVEAISVAERRCLQALWSTPGALDAVDV